MMEIYYKIECFTLRIIEKLESQKMSLVAWLVTFFAIYFLRVLLEAYSRGVDLFQFWTDSPSFYFTLFKLPTFFLFWILFFILLLHFLTKEKIEKISRLAIFVAPFIILMPPLIDLIASGGRGISMHGYTVLSGLPSSVLNFFQAFLMTILYGRQGILFFGETSSFMAPDALAINYGIRIQGGFILLGLIWYIFLKTKNIYRVLLGSVIAYLMESLVVVFVYAVRVFDALPSHLNPFFSYWHKLFILYFIGVCLLASLWFYAYNKEKFISLVRNLRISRVAHNLVLLALGFYLGGILTFDLQLGDIMLIILAVISLLLYWISAVGYDDLSDEKIDKISNPSRPIPDGKFTREEFSNLSNIFRIAAYFTAFVAGYAFFIFILLRSLVGYLYYAYPFRLKRFLIIATFTRSLTFLFTVYAGFLLISQNTIFDFPPKLAFFILIAFTLGITFKDIKDYQGDKASGIYTIPVIFGPEKGKKIIGLLTFAAFILAPLLFFDYFKILILPAFLSGTLSFYLIQKEEIKYKEFFLFLIYFSFGLFFILTCFHFL